MKTAEEFARAASYLISYSIETKRDMAGLLKSLFQKALDQMQWQDGPPTKAGRYLCEYEDGDCLDLTGRHPFRNESEIVCHLGPIPEATLLVGMKESK